jgi:hypothetical protein
LAINILVISIIPYAGTYFDDLKKIYFTREYLVLKCIRLLIRFLFPFGIINILSFLVEIFIYKKSYLEAREKPFLFRNIQDILIILSFVVFALALFLLHKFYWVFTLIIYWRLAEILIVQLSIIYTKKGNIIETANLFRTISLWAINFLEIIMIYAILYFSKNVLIIITDNIYRNLLIKPLDALYFSISTISTTGFGDIIVGSELGECLVFSEIIIGIFMLIIFFGILISRWKDKNDKILLLLRKVYKRQRKIGTLKKRGYYCFRQSITLFEIMLLFL